MAYAWTDIHLNDTHEDGKLKGKRVIRVGEEVSADDVGGEDEFDHLKRNGVIRDQKFPDYVKQGESVRTAIIRKAREDYESATADIMPEAMAILDPAPSEDETGEERGGEDNKEENDRAPWLR